MTETQIDQDALTGRALHQRFSDVPNRQPDLPAEVARLHSGMAARGSCRRFLQSPVAPALLDHLCALALSAPTKSDLQQRDIVLLERVDSRAQLAALVPEQPWIADAPVIAVFCGNNRRQRLLHEWQGRPFVNDHLDAFFNASVDAAVALSAFVTAAEAAGLGCCPISAVRNHPQAVSDMLNLPAHVFPVAGLAIGHPAAPPEVSPRLPLAQTVHRETYDETGLRDAVRAYDSHRQQVQPYAAQRATDAFGTATAYGWVEDKTRQYALPERAGFADFIIRRGFRLE